MYVSTRVLSKEGRPPPQGFRGCPGKHPKIQFFDIPPPLQRRQPKVPKVDTHFAVLLMTVRYCGVRLVAAQTDPLPS